WQNIILYFRNFYSSPLEAINEFGSFYHLWTGFVSIACLYNYLTIVLMVFDDVYNYYYNYWIYANILLDFVNILDIVVQSNFLLDILAILPLDFLLIVRPDFVWTRTNRLIKIYRIWDFVRLTETRTSFPQIFRVFKLTIICYIIFHLNGCLFFFISKQYNFETAFIEDWIFSYDKISDPVVPYSDFARNSPNITFFHTGQINQSYVEDLMHYWQNKTLSIKFGNFIKQYALSFYWSALTLVTLGEQPPPNKTSQNAFEIIVTLLGIIIFAVIVGEIGSVVINMNAVRADFEEKLDGCKQYMIFRDVPSQLQERINGWFEYVWEHGQAIVDEEAIAEFLPSRLYASLAVSVHMATLRKVKLFEDCEAKLLFELILMLKLQVFSPFDYVCKKGDIGKEMYIVKEGELEVVSEDGDIVFATLRAGTVFGELSILDIPGNKNGNKRSANVRSVGYSDLYVLTKSDLWEILAEYPHAKSLLIAKGISKNFKKFPTGENNFHLVNFVIPPKISLLLIRNIGHSLIIV
ncbi:unnamed protein product, partial [Dracunculus medinensis]|uniref:Cyclic nucleotide-binding domain-containing protein n=1 Tax=Dracunculus medinensis TaxID=318479 RepID=A0A0N4UHC7_DRAME